MDYDQFCDKPKAQNPTAQRLGELLSTWLPTTPQGIYDQYLQTLSPDYDHLLTYSRYDRIWRFAENMPYSLPYHSEISLLSSPVFVMDISDKDQVTDHRQYDGTNAESMRELELHLSNADLDWDDRRRCRIICAQHVTCSSMEALGSGLSLDPNVFSHHVGTFFKDIEKSTSIGELCNTYTEHIWSSVGGFERHKNLQILKGDLGRLSIANVEHAKDLTARDSILKPTHGLQRYPITFSVDVPRTIYVQGYESVHDRTQVIGRRLRARVLALQDRVLNCRIARKRFGDDSMLCDQGERYSQNGLDILQHITIHVTNESLTSDFQQVLVLFPPCPEFDGENGRNDPHVFVDPLTKQENIKTFKEFCRNRESKNRQSTDESMASRRTMSHDVETFANDILLGNQPGASRGLTDIVHIVRSYALNAWFDRLQILKDQLEDLSLQNSSHRSTRHNEDLQDSEEENNLGYELLDEEGMKSVILRYISSLDGECQRLKLDLREAKGGSSINGFGSVIIFDQTLERYTHIRSQMSSLLSETQHLLDVKNCKKQQALTTLQIKASKKLIEQAKTVKRYDIRLS
ncbi:unnamed protein product [Penicillium glandicola]